MNFKNMIFDLGGVVVNYNPKEYLLERFSDKDTEEFLYDAFFGSEEWYMLDKGTIEQKAADQVFMQRARKVGLAFEMQALIDDWYDLLRPKRDVCALILELKQFGYDIYYLSNISKSAMEFLRTKTTVMRLFSGGIASSDVRISKPEPEIYRRLLTEYNLRIEESVFIDDMPKNVESAHSLGLHSFLYTTTEQLKNSLYKEGIELFLGR